MPNLWSSNTPARFWLVQPDITAEQWADAIQQALPVLGLAVDPRDADGLAVLILGEGQFGSDHWQLSWVKRWYYEIKPFIPRALVTMLRRIQSSSARAGFPLGWPIEERYARFLWEVLRRCLVSSGERDVKFRPLWPDGRRFAFVLTHDVETDKGQAHVGAVADLDERYGFRSSFNFVPERYHLDYGLLQELRERGFEIGVHGLKHDGKLFSSYSRFTQRATRINAYLEQLGAVGFRAPLTMRNPEWMQELQIEYDLSFFDSDPYEPMAGGTMSIWPFIIGRFVELPYTLAQDHTLMSVLGETTPRLWLEKVDFLESYMGMALLNAHPDYLTAPTTWGVYAGFLEAMQGRGD